MTTLTTSTSIDPAKYHENDTYLSSSALSNFVSFDVFGIPTYNFPNFLNPCRPSGDALDIGTYVDLCITEGKRLDDIVSKKMSKDELLDQCDLQNIEYPLTKNGTPAATVTISFLKGLLTSHGFNFDNEVTNKVYDTCQTIMSRFDHFQYDAHTTLKDYVKECETQMILTNDDIWMRGKLDLWNPKRKRISDLKTTGNLDRIIKELTFKGEVNVYHKYARQLAIYRQLAFLQTGEWYECELIIIDHSGKHMILRMTSEALDMAWEQVLKDITVLEKYGKGDITDYAITLSATRKEPGIPVQNILEEEVEVEEETTVDKNF